MKQRLRRFGALLAGALMALALPGLTGCASWGIGLTPLEANLVDLQPLESTAFEQRFQVRMRLRNPNDQPIEIDGLRFELALNGKRLATGMSDQVVTLPRLGDVVIEVTTTTTLLDLLNQALEMSDRSLEESPSVEYSLRGVVYLAQSPARLSFERGGELQAAPPR